MKFNNVVEIYDNGEFVTLVTATGNAIHLPLGVHSIVLHSEETKEAGWSVTHVTVDFHTE